MAQASWGEQVWEITGTASQIFAALDLSTELKQVKNKDRDGQDSSATKGITRNDFSVSWTITPLAGVDVWATFTRWRDLIGSIATFRLGDQISIENAQLARVDLGQTRVDFRGRYLSAQIQLRFQIDDPEARKKKASNRGKVQLNFKGTGAQQARMGIMPTTGVGIGPSASDRLGKRGT